MEPQLPIDPNSTAAVQSILDRMRSGDESSVQALLEATLGRLRILAQKIGSNIPAVKRYEQTDDLLQNAMIRLWKAFDRHKPTTPLDYYRLASAIMRRELIDMSRQLFGPEGLGANMAKSAMLNASAVHSPLDAVGDETNDPNSLARWTEFHEYVDQLDEESKTLFDLLWYQGLSLDDAASLAGMSERTARRRWKAARLDLYRALLEP
jgi:RNA polymerase sigma factor (sigma-70 family)